jgi:hypothetical protein
MLQKTISALILASVVALMATTAALAGASEKGATTGLPHACANGAAALHNPNCGFKE